MRDAVLISRDEYVLTRDKINENLIKPERLKFCFYWTMHRHVHVKRKKFMCFQLPSTLKPLRLQNVCYSFKNNDAILCLFH